MKLLKISRFPGFIQCFPDFSRRSPDFSLTKFFKVHKCKRCVSLNPRLYIAIAMNQTFISKSSINQWNSDYIIFFAQKWYVDAHTPPSLTIYIYTIYTHQHLWSYTSIHISISDHLLWSDQKQINSWRWKAVRTWYCKYYVLVFINIKVSTSLWTNHSTTTWNENDRIENGTKHFMCI